MCRPASDSSIRYLTPETFILREETESFCVKVSQYAGIPCFLSDFFKKRSFYNLNKETLPMILYAVPITQTLVELVIKSVVPVLFKFI